MGGGALYNGIFIITLQDLLLRPIAHQIYKMFSLLVYINKIVGKNNSSTINKIFGQLINEQNNGQNIGANS